ncbi:MAG: DinB family protein [Acidobacteria bacterium]|nr:DinB family protein [Acidobacteriota bacterium]
MALVDALLPEFDHEMATTRTVLERVPDEKFDWKPHARSFSLGVLATHVAILPMWGTETLSRSEIDIGANQQPPTALPSRKEVLATFDRHVADARAALAGKTDAELMAMWSLKRNGRTVFSMPKTTVLRSFVLNHLVHHRGQLTVYLRLLDVPVPSIYGPSADEPAF